MRYMPICWTNALSYTKKTVVYSYFVVGSSSIGNSHVDWTKFADDNIVSNMFYLHSIIVLR